MIDLIIIIVIVIVVVVVVVVVNVRYRTMNVIRTRKLAYLLVVIPA